MSETTGKPWVWLTGRAACGCRFKLASDGVGAELSYCPLHAAARELLAALKEATPGNCWCDFDRDIQDKGHSLMCRYNEALIARAEGR